MSSPEFLFNIRTLSKKWFYDKDEVDELTKVEDEYNQMSYRPLSCRGLEIEFEKLRKETSSDFTSNYYNKIEIDSFISDLRDLILEYSDSGSVNVDDTLSTISLNPVQNKIITNALSSKSDNTHTHDNSYYTKTEMNTKLSGKSDNDHIHSVATIDNAGFMSSSDKSKLDGIATGVNKITVDSSLSSTSTNPVQNKIIQEALTNKANASHTHKDTDISTEKSLWGLKGGLGRQSLVNDVLFGVHDKVSNIDDYANNYKLPTASADILGGVKVGTNLSIDNNGVLSATDTTYGTATTSANGLMSSSDKSVLDNLVTEVGNINTILENILGV